MGGQITVGQDAIGQHGVGAHVTRHRGSRGVEDAHRLVAQALNLLEVPLAQGLKRRLHLLLAFVAEYVAELLDARHHAPPLAVLEHGRRTNVFPDQVGPLGGAPGDVLADESLQPGVDRVGLLELEVLGDQALEVRRRRSHGVAPGAGPNLAARGIPDVVTW